MAQANDTARAAVLRYLDRELPGCTLTQRAEPDSLEVHIQHGAETYSVEFSHEFLTEHSPDAIERLLGEWNLAGELQRAEGLEMSVSSAGIRLDSSN